MAKLDILAGTTSKLVRFFAPDSSSTTGAGLTGLTNATSGLVAYYHREGAVAGATAITLSAGTVGTWSSGGFKEIDATNMPGWYELGLPNAAIAASAKSVGIVVRGATNLAQVNIELQLTAVDNQDAVRFGLSALPNGPSMLKKNQALASFVFLLVSSTDHISPVTGATVTATRSIDGAAFAACANAASSVGSGMYKIDLAAADLNGNNIMLLFSATGCDARYISIITQP